MSPFFNFVYPTTLREIMISINCDKLELNIRFKFVTTKKYQTNNVLDFMDTSRMLNTLSERQKRIKKD